MDLTIFHAGKGDCLLLRANGTNILVDGGMRNAYREHVASALGALRSNGEDLDLLYVSHIDQDHISGVLQLMDDELAWRVFRSQRGRAGGSRAREPRQPRPPKVRRLWHNAFKDQVDANAGEIEELLAANATVLEMSNRQELRHEATLQRELAESVPEAIELSERASPEQLGIPVNRQFDGRLALVRPSGRPIKVGAFQLTVIGPFSEDLDVLRKDWNKWLKTNRRQLEDLRRRMREDAGRLRASELELVPPFLLEAASELGDRSDVTPPNLASLMLLAEADGRTVLLTGDGHAREIERGLKKADRLDAQDQMHVDVLKVQHHGAKANITKEFARAITADAYVFCGNGENGNPEPAVVDLILDARLGTPNKSAAGPSKQFRLLFNSSMATDGKKHLQDHMAALEKLVKRRADRSDGRLKFSFASGSSFDLKLRRR
jgi:beta-lactamase superfamily II metal-dependent hydrolase